MFDALGDYESDNEDEADSKDGDLVPTAAQQQRHRRRVWVAGGWATQRGLLVTPGDEDVNDEVGCSGRVGRSASQESRESRVGRGSGGLLTKALVRPERE